MNMLFSWFLLLNKCDNEEFKTNSINTLEIYNHTIDLQETYNTNSIKMSFGPQHLFRFNLKNGILSVYDQANYYTKEITFTIRLDYEIKYGPIADYVYLFIAYTAVVIGLHTILYFMYLEKLLLNLFVYVIYAYTLLQKFVDSHKLLDILSFTALMLRDTLFTLLFAVSFYLNSNGLMVEQIGTNFQK
ncbi:hypothetical protein ECANGB1_1967 [Enterospora canceri]|uniref:Uncharacterized protein n=1 Tax=Enterospora canceri TaxID=1081671 RepID=A0A1Y1S5B0_9MICR|nr:hypothetical protein ECANGB1_1967 [Enterospora canceri]